MNEEKQYKIQLESIKTRFQFKEPGKFSHNTGRTMKLLPYKTKDFIINDFSGVVGAFSRAMCDKELKSEFNFNEFLENVVDEIGEFEGANSKEAFRDVIKTMFIDKENLVDFDIKTINYASSTKADEKVAKFLYSIFFDDELKDLVSKHYDRSVENVLYKLVLNALPELHEKTSKNEGYKCYLHFIKELFIKDFKFLIKNQELYRKSLKRFLEYYYMFYISQLAMKLSRFEKADLTKPETIYYTLGWERTSKNRVAYEFGWKLLKSKVNSLFSHAITLELLNYNGLNSQFDYIELFNLFNTMDEKEVENELNYLFEVYKNQVTDKDWTKFRYKDEISGNKGFDVVYKIFVAIEYQFIKTNRTKPKYFYNNCFSNFVESNFAKKRGTLGYNLNLDEEDIILMTKICIGDDEKLKLSTLFVEFEKRGLYFDRDSKIKIVQLYEKLNLLEKKSDSGDAQYVRSVL